MAPAPENPITTSVLTDLIANTAKPLAAQVAQDAVNTAMTTVHQEATQAQQALNTKVTDLINTHRAEVSAQISDLATTLLHNAETDPVTERLIILAVLGTCLLAGFVVLVAALAGSGTANHYLVTVAAFFGTPLLYILKNRLVSSH